MSDKNETTEKTTPARPATGAAKKALDALIMEEEYEFYPSQNKNSAVFKGKVVKVGVPLAGYVTDLGVVLIDQQGSTHTVHAKWVTRLWVERAKEQEALKAERVAKQAAEAAHSILLQRERKAVTDDAPTWDEYRANSGNFSHQERTRWTNSNYICMGESFRVLSTGEVHAHFGIVDEMYVPSAHYERRRVGVITGFTKAGNPRVLWLLNGEKYDRIEKTYTQKDYDEVVEEETKRLLEEAALYSADHS